MQAVGLGIRLGASLGGSIRPHPAARRAVWESNKRHALYAHAIYACYWPGEMLVCRLKRWPIVVPVLVFVVLGRRTQHNVSTLHMGGVVLQLSGVLCFGTSIKSLMQALAYA